MKYFTKNLFILLVFVLINNYTNAQHFTTVWTGFPNLPMGFYVSAATIDGNNLEADDEIAVFDVETATGNEICVGAIVLTGPIGDFVNFSASTDEGGGTQNGFIPGHEIIYRFWDNSESKEIVLINATYLTGSVTVFTSQEDAFIDPLVGASVNVWDGSEADNDWDNADNWDTGLPTNAGADVEIPSGLTYYPTLTVAAECNDLLIKSDASGNGSIKGDSYLTVNGSSTVQRYLTGGKWHDFAAPVNDQTLNNLYFNNNPDVWIRKYNEPDNSRTYMSELSDPIPLGTGFEVWVETGNNVVANFVGDLQTTDLTITTPTLSYSGAHPLGYNLIGNPYASPLDWDIGTWNPTDVVVTIWVWDPIAGNYVDRNDASSGSLTDGIIPVGQGFFVQATGSSPSITIPVDARVHSGQAYYKRSNANNDLEKISLRVNYGERKDEVNIAFSTEYTEDFDSGLDNRKLFSLLNDVPSLYTEQADEFLSISCLPALEEESYIVPIHFDAGVAGEYEMAVTTENMDETTIVLEDVQTGTFLDLENNTVYLFNAGPVDDYNRFVLHFNPIPTGINDLIKDDSFHVYNSDNNIYIKSIGIAAEKNKEVYIYDMLGRMIQKTEFEASQLNKIQLLNSNEIVVVKIVSENTYFTTKVFVK